MERRHSLLGLPLPPGRGEGVAIKTWVKCGSTHSRIEGQLGEWRREGLGDGDEWRLHHHFRAARKKMLEHVPDVSACDRITDRAV